MAQDTDVSPEWQAILDEANGQTVNWFMWGGSDAINSYVSDWVGAKAAELGVTINRVPLTDTVDAVNTVLGEQQAGRDEDGSVDMIWINGENFKTGKQADLWFCGWTEALPNYQYVDGDSAAILNDFGTPVDQCESPWSHAQFAFTYNSDVVTDPPSTMAELLQWIKDNPGPVHISGAAGLHGLGLRAPRALPRRRRLRRSARRVRPGQVRRGRAGALGDAQRDRAVALARRARRTPRRSRTSTTSSRTARSRWP